MNIIWFLIFFILCTGIFTGMEYAFLFCNRLRIELGIKQERTSAQLLAVFMHNPLYFRFSLILGCLLSQAGFVIVLVVGVSTDFSHPIEMIVKGFIAFVMLFFIVELPIRIFVPSNANRMLSIFSIPLYIWYLITIPITWFSLVIVQNLFKETFKKFNAQELESSTFGKWMFEPGINESENFQESREMKIFQKAMEFSEVRIRDCMIRRMEVESIEVNASLEELTQKFIHSGYSKLIVYKETIDNVVGYISSKELFKNPSSIKEKLHNVSFVPETMPANRMLHEFMLHHRSIAVVVDEYGGTSGIVTLEDVIEEIFGEIEDEHDTDDLIERQVKRNEFVLSGQLQIEYLNTRYGIGFPESESYKTLAGFILYHHHNLPKVNDLLEDPPFSMKILKTSSTRIELVYLKVLLVGDILN